MDVELKKMDIEELKNKFPIYYAKDIKKVDIPETSITSYDYGLIYKAYNDCKNLFNTLNNFFTNVIKPIIIDIVNETQNYDPIDDNDLFEKILKSLKDNLDLFIVDFDRFSLESIRFVKRFKEVYLNNRDLIVNNEILLEYLDDIMDKDIVTVPSIIVGLVKDNMINSSIYKLVNKLCFEGNARSAII